MTRLGYGGLAVEAMQHGVRDFVEKPWATTGCWKSCAPRWIADGKSALPEASNGSPRGAAEKHDQEVNRQAGEIDRPARCKWACCHREFRSSRESKFQGRGSRRANERRLFRRTELDDHRFAFCIADIAREGSGGSAVDVELAGHRARPGRARTRSPAICAPERMGLSAAM